MNRDVHEPFRLASLLLAAWDLELSRPTLAFAYRARAVRVDRFRRQVHGIPEVFNTF